MKYSSNQAIRDLVRELVRSGWSYRRGGKHGKLLVICTNPRHKQRQG